VRRLSEERVVSAVAGWARRFDLVNDPGTDDVVSWTPDGRRCVPRPPLPPVKGGRAACARAGVRAPGRATHLDRERPADHPLCAARGSFVVWQHEKFEREVLPLWFPKMTSLRRFNRELRRYVRARHQLPPCVCAGSRTLADTEAAAWRRASKTPNWTPRGMPADWLGPLARAARAAAARTSSARLRVATGRAWSRLPLAAATAHETFPCPAVRAHRAWLQAPATCSTSAGRCVRRRAHAAPVRQPCRVNLGDHVLCVLFRAPLNRNRLPPAALRVAGSRLDVPMPRAILPAAGQLSPALAIHGARACMAVSAPAVTCAARRWRADESDAEH